MRIPSGNQTARISNRTKANQLEEVESGKFNQVVCRRDAGGAGFGSNGGIFPNITLDWL